MHDMALAAAKLGRKATCKSYLAQKNTHDSAVAQYAGLISTLVQQQTVQVRKQGVTQRGHTEGCSGGIGDEGALTPVS